jgi:hypothetical protein
MIGDIVQDQQDGWFFRDNGDGTLDDLSDPAGGCTPETSPKVTTKRLRRPVVLYRNGALTGVGDPLAGRVAAMLARRYA